MAFSVQLLRPAYWPTYRDDHMMELHQKYPLYGWDKNKGYGTTQHREAILKHGQCPHHRLSFKLREMEEELNAETPV